MSSVAEIEQAIELLPESDFAVLRRWFVERDVERWDRQMDEDAMAGRLDFLFVEAETERSVGGLRSWPEQGA